MGLLEKNKLDYEGYVRGIDVCDRTSPYEASYQESIKLVFDAALKYTNVERIISKSFRRKSTKQHCPIGYKIEGTASPDLILAEDFIYHNVSAQVLPKPKYHALVEVKKPNEIKMTDYEEVIFNAHDKNQLETYLQHPAINKLIYTDGYTWVFYANTLVPQKIIKLRHGKEWKYSKKNLAGYAQELHTTQSEPEEWGELHSYIYDFVSGNC